MASLKRTYHRAKMFSGMNARQKRLREQKMKRVKLGIRDIRDKDEIML